MAYTKKLKTINITLIGCSDEPASLTAADTVETPTASYALEDFKAERYMDFEDNDMEYLVPFHAVDHIIITEASESVEDKPNPYGCEASSKDSPWAIFTIPSSGEDAEISFSGGVKTEINASTSKTYEEWVDIFNNPDDYTITAIDNEGTVSELQYEIGTGYSTWISGVGNIDLEIDKQDGVDEIGMYYEYKPGSSCKLYVTKK